MSAVVELQQPRKLVHRVEGRDVRVLVDRPYVYLSRDDVESIAGVPPWGTGEVLVVDDQHSIEVAGVAYVPLDVAIARVRDDSTSPERAALFLEWIESELPMFTNPEVLANAEKPAGVVVGSYTVAAAAKSLSDATGARIGRDGLFAHMDALGWIERNSDTSHWMITALPHNRGWLAIHTVAVGPRGRNAAHRYLQIYVTPAGLQQLATTIALPAAAGAPAAAAPPTLFD